MKKKKKKNCMNQLIYIDAIHNGIRFQSKVFISIVTILLKKTNLINQSLPHKVCRHKTVKTASTNPYLSIRIKKNNNNNHKN